MRDIQHFDFKTRPKIQGETSKKGQGVWAAGGQAQKIRARQMQYWRAMWKPYKGTDLFHPFLLTPVM
jgi:hypothetical protein